MRRNVSQFRYRIEKLLGSLLHRREKTTSSRTSVYRAFAIVISNLRIYQIFCENTFYRVIDLLNFPISIAVHCLHIVSYRFDEKCVIKISIVVRRTPPDELFRSDKEMIIAVI